MDGGVMFETFDKDGFHASSKALMRSADRKRRRTYYKLLGIGVFPAYTSGRRTGGTMSSGITETNQFSSGLLQCTFSFHACNHIK
ncbi:hypothetical protein PR202_ga21514 [Eleusine coracana subsp. coracana]|uniref:Uncharacterized protein n=1 Tax=Eleusine coracana subsp. coracana TaxID=191504 RepID=A0AAV5D120_ELECO|nr:hypothetical protein PR202_ga21514 [Eleusine coracana subsp. coracana]